MKRRGQSGFPERLKFSNKAKRKLAQPEEAPQTWLRLPRGNKAPLPSRFRGDDVRCADALVEHFLSEFTTEGQTVLDPFAGYGTSLLIAEEMGRLGYGIEYSAQKTGYVHRLLAHPERLIHGDSRRLLEYDLPRFDLCLTSPPYTHRSDAENPFVDYRKKGFDYPSYLQEIGRIFSQVAQKLNPSGHAVIEVANLKKNGEVTTLAWDVAHQVSQVLHFEGETVVCWDQYGYGYNHSYCLVFAKP